MWTRTVVFQYDKDLIEVWDEAKRLRCEWYNDYEKGVTKPPIRVSDIEVVELNFRGNKLNQIRLYLTTSQSQNTTVQSMMNTKSIQQWFWSGQTRIFTWCVHKKCSQRPIFVSFCDVTIVPAIFSGPRSGPGHENGLIKMNPIPYSHKWNRINLDNPPYKSVFITLPRPGHYRPLTRPWPPILKVYSGLVWQNQNS